VIILDNIYRAISISSRHFHISIKMHHRQKNPDRFRCIGQTPWPSRQTRALPHTKVWTKVRVSAAADAESGEQSGRESVLSPIWLAVPPMQNRSSGSRTRARASCGLQAVTNHAGASGYGAKSGHSRVPEAQSYTGISTSERTTIIRGVLWHIRSIINR
jgi:hypothetical protein